MLGFFLAIAAALVLAMTRGTGGSLVYPLDDTYIQMAIAKTLAAHGAWGVTRFEFSGAGSSLLWPPLLAALDRLTGLGARLPLIVNLLAAVLVVWMADGILARHLASGTGRAIALALVIVGAPLPALATIGMEHTLQCAVALALMRAGASWCAEPGIGTQCLPAGVALLGCAIVAVRYDAASVVVAVAILIVGARGWRSAAAFMLASATPVVGYAAMAFRHGWPALPTPVLLKQRLGSVDILSWHGAADLLGGGALTVLVNTPALVALVLLGLALVATSSRDRDSPRRRESLFLVLVFLIATGVHLQFGRVGWLYRYEAYLIVLGIVATASAIGDRLSARWPQSDPLRAAAAAALALVLVAPLFQRALLASRLVITSAADLYRHEYVWGRFFQQYPPDGGLLVGDLGAVAYFTDVPLVDAGGLATLELLPHRWSDPMDVAMAVRVARSRGVRVSIIDGPYGGRATGWPCVAAWTVADDPTPNATIWLAAADDEAAAHLARDLRSFTAQRAGDGFSVRFPAPGQPCQGP
jgi:hypothetical protein